MTKAKVRKTFAQQRPERSLSDVAKETKGEQKSKGINKSFTAVQKAEGDGNAAGMFMPNDEQLAKINEFTQRPVGAEEVVCFNTLSCNDQLDRDLDRFTTECVEDFAKLPDPYSSVGKGFMVSHDYTKLPVGTVFEVGTKSVEGIKHLTNAVFMPNTEQYKNFIENMEFGIYRFVSVGVMLDDSACTVCQSPMVGNYWTFCIENGHEKGLWYDPDSDEKDSWGWAEPVAEGTKGAVLCTRDLFAPKDFYELSQVFLGAQYGAQLERSAGTKGIVKGLATAKVPMLGLSLKEATSLPVPIPHINPRVREAYDKGLKIISRDASSINWVDEQDLVWTFDAEEDEVLCLGEFKGEGDEEEVDDDTDTEEGGDDDGEGDEGQDDDADASGSDDAIGEPSGQRSADADESEGDDDEADADAEAVADEDSDEDDSDDDESEDDEEDEDDDEEEDDEDVDEKSVTAAVAKAKLPKAVKDAVGKAKGGNALGVLLSSVSKEFAEREEQTKELQKAAKLGAQFVEAKKAEAIKWYVRNRQAGKTKAVSTEKFQRMLDRFGDDIELLDEVIEEQKQSAQEKFPASVRRSTAPTDPHAVEDPQPLTLDKEAAEKVRKAHG